MPEEYVQYFSGTGAKKLIEIPETELPSNTTVSITQAGEVFQVFMTSSLDNKDTKSFDLINLMYELGAFSD